MMLACIGYALAEREPEIDMDFEADDRKYDADLKVRMAADKARWEADMVVHLKIVKERLEAVAERIKQFRKS